MLGGDLPGAVASSFSCPLFQTGNRLCEFGGCEKQANFGSPVDRVKRFCTTHKKEGHVKDDCPEPEKCFNCRKEGHTSSDCPEPEKCRKCRKEVGSFARNFKLIF